MAFIFETHELTKKYGNKGIESYALHGIELYVEEGDFLGIMGPSGSGKTTLLNLLSTIDKQTSGQILFNGKELARIKNKDLSRFRRDNIGFIFQDYNLLDNMSVEDNISLPLALNKVPHNVIKEKLSQMSRFFGVEGQLKKYPYQLSGGQKQRVSAARALITSPAVVLADEPTGALDSKAATELLGSLADMNEKLGTTIVMVTHDVFAASYCKRVLFLADGRIHARLDKDTSRKELYQRILAMMASLGGSENHEYI
jgi:putative ABC transport system ATP-binding protein